MKLIEFTKLLDGREYPFNLTEKEQKIAKENGFVVVYGASDDLIEFDGTIREEGTCYEDSTFLVDDKGPLSAWEGIDHDDETEVMAYQKRKSKAKKTIKAIWDVDGYSWKYESNIPHETFEIVEDGEKYCRGIVFNISEIK